MRYSRRRRKCGLLARHEMAGDHQFGKAVRFLEEGGTDRNLLAARLGVKVDYADWLLNHARKMKRGTIRVVGHSLGGLTAPPSATIRQ